MVPGDRVIKPPVAVPPDVFQACLVIGRNRRRVRHTVVQSCDHSLQPAQLRAPGLAQRWFEGGGEAEGGSGGGEGGEGDRRRPR